MKKIALNGAVYDFWIGSVFIDIKMYLISMIIWPKKILDLWKRGLSFTVQLDTQKVRRSSLDNEAGLIRPTLIDQNLDKLCGYPFVVNLSCAWSCNTPDGWSKWLCLSNETEGVNIKVCNVITEVH